MPPDEKNYPKEYVDRLGWHEAFTSSMNNVSDHSSELAYLARCLEVSGNEVLSDKLYALSMAIAADVNVAEIAISTYINNEYDAGNKAIGNTLNAIMDVAERNSR